MTSHDTGAAGEPIDQDFMSGAAKAYHSLQTKVGQTDRNRKITTSAVVFLGTLIKLGGTFVWEGPKVRFNGQKFATIFQALASTLPEYDDLGYDEQHEFVKDRENRLRNGFYNARSWMTKWYMDTVFLVSQGSESSLPTVITLDPDYVLKSGKTASQIQGERDYKLADGQIRASTRRLASATKQKDDVRTKLDKIMARAITELEDMRPERE